MNDVWPDEQSPFDEAFDPAVVRNPCIRVLHLGANGVTDNPGESAAYTLAEWERLERECPEMFVEPPDPENRAATVIVRYVVPGNDHYSPMNNVEQTNDEP